jgi:hypothetical protein
VSYQSRTAVRVCIYCLEKKPDEAFNAVHVVPQAFGQFEGNLVLGCVCTECNDYFGRTIDLKLARDSIEGIDRYWSGMKPVSEFKSLSARSTTSARFKEGSIYGEEGYPAANADGEDLRVMAFPQLGFEQPAGTTRWFRVPQVPEKARLPDVGIDPKKEFFVHVREMSATDAGALLRSKGYDKIGTFSVYDPPAEESIETMMVGIIGRPEKRAATKIAMNYLADVAGPALLRTAAFDEVRQFARHDAGESRVHVSENPWGISRKGTEPARGHYLAVRTEPSGRIVAQVSLMLRIRYVVHLMSVNLVTGTPTVASAHFFDLDTKSATRIPTPPLVPGKQLKVAAE